MKKAVFFFAVFITFCISCGSNSNSQFVYQVPEKINDELEVGSLKDVKMDTILITKAINRINRGKYGEIHSLLIYKDNQLVLDEYFAGHKYQWDAPDFYSDWVSWNKNTSHSIMSVTKSITSICVGIAIDKGFIKSVNQSIFDYLPEHQDYKGDGRESITIEHLLTMTSGLAWNEWGASYNSKENPIIGIWFSDKDPVSFILHQRVNYQPGTHFSYFGGHQILLGEIIKNASGMSIDKFSKKYLFTPLGIDSANWSTKFDNGVFEAASGLRIKPRDMLKIGVTFLNKGMWEGKRIISEQWIEKSANPFAVNTNIDVPGEDTENSGYSYSWWTDELEVEGKTLNTYHAAGWGGQKIIVIPDLNTVIVFTGGNYTSKVRQFSLLEDYLLPAIIQN